MKKIMFVLLGLSLSAAAMAQAPDSHKEKVKATTDLQTDVRAHKAATHQVNHDLSHARVRRAVQDHKAVATTNKMTNTDSKRLQAQGVKHPVAKAKRQVRVQDDKQKDHI
jgi:hypothetical protein